MHFLGPLEVAVGEPAAAEAHLVDRAAPADAGDHVLKDAPVGVMEQNVVGHDRSHPMAPGRLGKLMESELVPRPPSQGQSEMGVRAEGRNQPLELHVAPPVGAVRDEHGDQTLREGGDILPAEHATALARAALAQGQQPAQTRVGRAVPGIDEQDGVVLEDQLAADDQPHPGDLGRFVGPNDPGEAVAVGDRQGFKAADGGLPEQFLAGTGAAQKGEVGRAMELGVAHRADMFLFCSFGESACKGTGQVRVSVLKVTE